MSRENELMFKYIQKAIEERGLTTEKEINEFLKNEMLGKNFEDFEFDEDDMSDEEIAQDIVEKASLEKDDYEAISLIGEALTMDKNCIEAYVLLATKQIHPFLTEYFLKKAVKVGKKKFSKEFLEENKEHIWAIHETRPYLKALSQLAHYYYATNDFWQSVKILSKTIAICPTDNLGNRELLLTQLLSIGKYKKAKKYLDLYQDDCIASTCFSRVFYSYYNDNDIEKTDYLLKAAKQANSHIIKKIINPNIKLKLNETFALGSPEEANNYCYFAREMWQEDSELIDWLKQNQ